LAGNFLAVNYRNQKLANISIFKAITSKCPGEAIMHCQKTGSPTQHNKNKWRFVYGDIVAFRGFSIQGT
jgi:hypothetical protein